MKPDQITIDRVVAEVASELMENVDTYMAHWKKTRGKPTPSGQDTDLAEATGLGVDVFPIIADTFVRAWEWALVNPYDLACGVESSQLASYVSSILQESREKTGLDDKELPILVNLIAQKVVETAAKE